MQRQSVEVKHSDILRENSLQNLRNVDDLMVLQIELRDREVIDQRVELNFRQVARYKCNGHEHEDITH